MPKIEHEGAAAAEAGGGIGEGADAGAAAAADPILDPLAQDAAAAGGVVALAGDHQHHPVSGRKTVEDKRV